MYHHQPMTIYFGIIDLFDSLILSLLHHFYSDLGVEVSLLLESKTTSLFMVFSFLICIIWTRNQYFYSNSQPYSALLIPICHEFFQEHSFLQQVSFDEYLPICLKFILFRNTKDLFHSRTCLSKTFFLDSFQQFCCHWRHFGYCQLQLNNLLVTSLGNQI